MNEMTNAFNNISIRSKPLLFYARTTELVEMIVFLFFTLLNYFKCLFVFRLIRFVSHCFCLVTTSVRCHRQQWIISRQMNFSTFYFTRKYFEMEMTVKWTSEVLTSCAAQMLKLTIVYFIIFTSFLLKLFADWWFHMRTRERENKIIFDWRFQRIWLSRLISLSFFCIIAGSDSIWRAHEFEFFSSDFGD